MHLHNDPPTTRHTVYPRYPLDQMMSDPALYYQYQLLLLGMHEMTTADPSSIWSHYQIGGIHGLPFETYNQANTGVQWKSLNGSWYGGLCWYVVCGVSGTDICIRRSTTHLLG